MRYLMKLKQLFKSSLAKMDPELQAYLIGQQQAMVNAHNAQAQNMYPYQHGLGQQQAQLNNLYQQQAQQEYQPPPNIPPGIKARAMLISRLDSFGATWLRKEDFLGCHVKDETVYVFFVFKENGGCVTDERSLFPSDGLIAQLRILGG